MRIGFLVNPIAGMGGRVGLKGTDGVVDEARRRGARPVAPGRAAQALAALRRVADEQGALGRLQWLTCSGEMGASVLSDAGFRDFEIVHGTAPEPSAADTTAAATAFARAGADLVLFCGGDGTARDIVAALSDTVPILGIPAGVKMYSGVFAMTPARAAEIVLGFLEGRLASASVDIVDLDEERYRAGEWSVRLFDTARTPYEPSLTPAAKALIDSASDEDARREIATDLSERMRSESGTLFLLGPGSTVQAIAVALGLPSTLLGIDAVLDCRVIGRDLDAGGIATLLDSHPDCILILSPLGAQGFVLGRGNQQLSPESLSRIGAENIVIVATPAKLARTPVLRFDTGDPALDAVLVADGYVPVVTGYRRRRLVKALA